ncbi:MAG TPA: sulfatase, partial [Phycisphaerae bacterium]|nr:sulfatase [Phycisphaerae bacterium]
MKKTKVILIMTDTQRKDQVGCYGNKDMKTPNLDRLADGGMRFERAYTTQPVCGPARSGLFVGTFPHTNGSISNESPLFSNARHIGQRLQAADIRTAYIGKWHLDASDYFGAGQCPDGWDPDYWYDMRNYLEELTPEERKQSRKGSTVWDEERLFGHRCSDRAIDFLETHQEDSYFLTVSYDEPHGPGLCPQRFRDMHRDTVFPKSPNVWDRLEDKPAHQRAWGEGRITKDKDALRIRGNFGCNSYVDYEIGRVLDTIDQFAPDALVIYTSDHGDMVESHSLFSKGPAMYEEITNIPCIVRWPG